MTEARAPAAEQTVWTMLFSRMLEPEKSPRKAIEITAAGIEVANGEPHLQSQIHIGGGEEKGERHAQGDAAPGKFFVVLGHARPENARRDFACNPGLGQFHETLLAGIGREPHPLIEGQGAGMIQGAGVDQQLGDGLGQALMQVW